MTREEAIALGVPVEKYREFQALYNRDLQHRMKQQRQVATDNMDTRSAIDAMLKLVKNQDSLDTVLKTVYRVYAEEV